MVGAGDFKQSLSSMKIHMSPRGFKIAVLFALVCVLLFVWVLNSKNGSPFDGKKEFSAFISNPLDHIDKFSNNLVKYEDIRRVCYRNKDPKSIEDLKIHITLLSKQRHLLCQRQYKLFDYIYKYRVKYTTIKISDTFMVKVKKWLHDNRELIDAAKNQSLIFVDNKYTLESVVFNPVRSNRPGVGAGNTLNYIKDIVSKSSDSCDFCSYVNNTASDLFGRMESKYSVIVSNTFKIEKYHGLALLKTHDPLYFNQLQFIDCMELAIKWFQHVNQLLPNHLYRFMYWDILPKSSASQIHPHLHLALGDDSYYAKWNHLFKSASIFSRHHNQLNYWSSLLQIHTSLGLSISFGKASLIAYLTPQKDYEVVLMAHTPCLDFFRLAFFTIRAFIDDLSQYAMSMGFVFPKISSNTKYGDELPMLLRIVSRGPADNPRSDISSFDLFGTPNVNKDPFVLIVKLRESIGKTMLEKFEYPQWKD